jgi:rhamnosyltransferase
MISVIIPVKNGAATLERCLNSLVEQTVNKLEIIVLDSGSTDASIDIAKRYGAKIINVLPKEFNHGLTRNIGVSAASGSLLYFTVQDAWLSESTMLERMVTHFNDASTMAVVGHQAIPWGHVDKNPAYWFKRISEPEVEIRHFPDTTVFANLPKDIQFEKSRWDNVNAMYRKAVLMTLRFRNTNYSEDCLWANDALRNGLKIFRDSSLVVYHYHHMTFNYVYKTSFIVYYNFFRFFGIKQMPLWSPLQFLRASFAVVKRKEINIRQKIYWVWHNAVGNLGFFSSSLYFSILGKKGTEQHFLKLSKQLPQGKQNS